MENIEGLKERYLNLYPSDGVDEDVLSRIENILKIRLPRDFCKIASFYSGGYLGGISNYSFSDTDGSTNIIEETIRLRKTINLPVRFIVLAEPAESLIVMDTEHTPSIIWCDAVEASKLGTKSFISIPDEWSSYMEYFSQLLEDEEEEL
ncbi:SMI1/KNR4 family protein [Oceanirhabdus sp. W0125-5]|uniref:SMI1/KNR4 family protein n=1 Tax=Oceanirhabdus sp. W0125-5 TaxID=2999116 RepID=UPI0022F2FE14|nr:SMI1/KNR4 family protein [Oceanirhabdus sp. W0125-5]WBW96119.1 SMI1/KNR4 family protein [Oceanirhabdus sp. W0125-5]